MNNLPRELVMIIVDFLFTYGNINKDLKNIKNTSKYLNNIVYYDSCLRIKKINYSYKEMCENLDWFYTPLNINIFFR
jgi:hypothetical protein